MKQQVRDAGIFDILEKRMTHRNFRDAPIEDDVFEILMDVAASAASSGGLQRISIVAVRDPERRKKLVEMSRGQTFVEKAPLSLVFCVDHRRVRRVAEYEGSLDEPALAIELLWMGIIDAAIAAQSVALAAEAFGLGSCYNGNILEQPEEMSALLELPAGVVPALMLTLGYPSSSEYKPSKKFDRSMLLHDEVYRDRPVEELYSAYKEKHPQTARLTPARRESLYRALSQQYGEEVANARIEKVDEAGVLTPYQFLFGCYYFDDDQTYTQAQYLDFLAKNGFDFRK